MRVAFAGTPAFAARALQGLVDEGHELVLVLSQPDRPAGRGLKLLASPVSVFARERSLPLDQPAQLKTADSQQRLRDADPDVLVVAAYGIILPQAVLDIPAHGCLNIHASLLPRWRGAAPVQRAILAGDAETGVCIMHMDAGLDTGPVIARRALEIGPRATAGDLTERLAESGCALLLETLRTPAPWAEKPQAGEATYAAKIDKREARLDWRRPAAELDRQVRAFNPFPGAHAILGGEAIKIWEAEPCPAAGPPGTVSGLRADAPIVACGSEGLVLTVLQKPGGKRVPAADLVRSGLLAPGRHWDS